MKNLIEKIKNLNNIEIDEIVGIAYDNWNAGGWDGICLLSPDGVFEGVSLNSNSRLGEKYKNHIVLYQIKSNWINNNVWDDHNQILDDDEWKKLIEKFGEEADFLNSRQLHEINICFHERAREYLYLCLINDRHEFIENILNNL